MSAFKGLAVAVACSLVAGCVAPRARTRRDERPDGLYGPLMGDGKYDSDGQLIGALTFDAASDCAHDTGAAQAEGWAGRPGDHAPGALCRVQTPELGGGRLRVNVRALVQSVATADNEPAPVMTIVVRDVATDKELGREAIALRRFEEALTYRNLVVEVTRNGVGRLEVVVEWAAKHALRIEHVQVYRARRRVVIEPASGVLAADATLRLALVQPPDGYALRFDCDGRSLGERFAALELDGKVTREVTRAATVVSLPAAELLAGCLDGAGAARLRVELRSRYYTVATSRVTYRTTAQPCSFVGGGKKPRLLLTGFEPFPATGGRDNSSEQAVLAYAGRADVEIMRSVLPVEWDSAAATLRGLIKRCKPDVVLSFGQGRHTVDVETTAYNSKDSFDIAGGAKDNRGMLFAGQAIVKGGAAKLQTRLPVDAIVKALANADETTSASDDPGRYICNNLFYELMHSIADSKRVGGFVHLPTISRVREAEKKRLARIVSLVVDRVIPPKSTSRGR